MDLDACLFVGSLLEGIEKNVIRSHFEQIGSIKSVYADEKLTYATVEYCDKAHTWVLRRIRIEALCTKRSSI